MLDHLFGIGGPDLVGKVVPLRQLGVFSDVTLALALCA
jgi:hypothetical protein